MTMIFEIEGLSSPGTESGGRSSMADIEVRRKHNQQAAKPVTTGIPQRSSIVVSMPEFQQQPKIMGRVERSQSHSRIYQVKEIGFPQIRDKSQSSDMLLTKHQEHRRYLQRVSSEGVPSLISQATAKKSWNLWLAVRKATGNLMPIPSAGTGPDGVMYYSWDREEHHLEAEIYPDQNSEFFYRNRQTGELWGEYYSDGALPVELLSKLSLFFDATSFTCR